MHQQSYTPQTVIKTIHVKEVSLIGSPRNKRGFCSAPVRILCESLCLLLFFVPLLLFAVKWPSAKDYIHGKMLSKTRLAPTSDGFESWTNPPVTTVRAYRLFDIKNAMAVMTSSRNPTIELRETQPLTYQVKIKKNNIQWSNDSRILQYSLERFFTREGEFDETMLNQEGFFVDILRVIFRTKFARVADPSFFILGGNNAFNQSKAIDKLEGFISPLFGAISSGMQGPNKDKYGFIYRYNGSNGFNFTIDTGLSNSSEKGHVIDFASEYTKFKTRAEDWQTRFFDGMTYPPLGNPPYSKVINIFQPDFCRPIQLRYNRTVSMFGIDQVHEYVLKLVDVNECPAMDENCPEVEKLDITKCFSAEIAPGTIFLTKPHMYGHNSSSTGVAFNPDADKHESTVYFEPLTGTPLSSQSRIQMNVNAWIDRLNLEEDGSTQPAGGRAMQRFIPMMWIDQTVTLNEAILNRLTRVNGILQKGHRAHRSIKLIYILLALLSLVALVALIELFLWNRQRKQIRRSLYQSSSEQEKALLNHTLTTSPTTA